MLTIKNFFTDTIKIWPIHSRKKYLNLSIIVIIAAAFLLYGNTIGHGYAADDVVLITENSYTLAGLHKVKEIITDDGVLKGWLDKDKSTIEENGFRKRYRPIAQLTFAAEVQLFGKSPHISHFINILLFAFTGALIFMIITKLVKYLPDKIWYNSLPFMISLLFISHPIHTEVVANIKSRDEILALLFSLLSLHYIIKYFESNKVKYLIYYASCFLLALLSKENAITFLALIPIIIYFFDPNFFLQKQSFLSKLKFTLIPLVITTILFLILTYIILGNNNDNWGQNTFGNYFINCDISHKYGTILYSLGKYLQLIILPYNLICDYSAYQIPIVKITDIIPIITITFYLLMVAYVIIMIRKRNIAILGIIFFIITILFYSNLFFLNGTAVAERFLYFPSLGFCIILGYIISVYLPQLFKRISINSNYRSRHCERSEAISVNMHYLTDRHASLAMTKRVFRDNLKTKANQWLPFCLILLIFGLYSFKTITRNADWKDTQTLIRADVNKPNNSANLNYTYAQLFYNAETKKDSNFINNVKIAKTYYLKAVTINPKFTSALNYLGNCYYIADKNYDSAIYCYLKSLKAKGDQQEVYKIIVGVLDLVPDSIYSLKIYNELIKLNPNQPVLNFRLGKAFRKCNKIEQAIFYMEKSLQLNSKYKAPANDLISIYKTMNGSKKQLYIYNLQISMIYKENLENYDSAVFFAEKAIKIFPADPQAYFDIGTVYYSKGDKRKAAEYLEISNKISPNNPEVINNLKIIYRELVINSN